eukprot:202206_1
MFALLYDILAVTISVLDVSTDVIVCIEFYLNGRWEFFGISITILFLALVAYDISFIVKYSDEWKVSAYIQLFFALLPISPFLPFIFYFADSSDKFANFIENTCCWNISIHENTVPDDASRLKKFMVSKINKHLGFIIEALVEAFPQAILQMTYCVLYNEANIVSITSILISLLSVASKSFVVSIGTAITLKQLFFNWLCAVTDFFGIFFAVSWAFYHPNNDELIDAFITIKNIWLFKIFLMELPVIGAISISFHLLMMFEAVHDHDSDGIVVQICAGIGAFVILTFGWICGVIASVLSLEILNWTWLCGVFWYLGTQRFPDNKTSSELYFTLIKWINSAHKHHVGSIYKGFTSYTKKQDKIMRISSVNYTIYNGDINGECFAYCKDTQCLQYLMTQKEESQYMNVTMNGLRIHSDNKHSKFSEKFWNLYQIPLKDQYRFWEDRYSKYQSNPGCYTANRCCQEGCLLFGAWTSTFIWGPIYFLSRFLTLFFPLFIVIYLQFGYNVNIWNTSEVELLQVVMITIYIGLCVILSILLYLNAHEQYLMAHILPSKSTVPHIRSESVVTKSIKSITDHYYSIAVIPIRKALVYESFGPDLGEIILSFLPTKDHYEDSDKNVIRVKNVV